MLNAADFPRDQYAAYWETIEQGVPGGLVLVRIYERGSGKGCVAEQLVPPAGVDEFIRAAMAAYRKQEA